MTPTLPKPLQKLATAFKDDKRLVNLAVAAGLAGMLLIAVSEWLPSGGAAGSDVPQESPAAFQDTAARYEQELEARLEALICQVEGAGAAQVMVTLAESPRTVYATDTETDAAGSSRSEHLLLADGADPPALVESTLSPQVQGVAVLCEGGGDVTVQAKVTEIVKVLTGAGASSITVERLTQQG